jgi:hypothetical protein
MGETILHPREQCLERGKETASNRAGAAGLVAATDSEDHRGASGDDLRLLESRGNRNAAARGQIVPAKPATQSEEVITDLSAITLHGPGYLLAGIYWMLQH